MIILNTFTFLIAQGIISLLVNLKCYKCVLVEVSIKRIFHPKMKLFTPPHDVPKPV